MASVITFFLLIIERAGGEIFSDQEFLIHQRIPDIFMPQQLLQLSDIESAIQQVHGIAPKQFLDSLRLQKAMSMLKNTHLDIKEISLNCGFDNANYFAKFFYRHRKMSPSQFRIYG